MDDFFKNISEKNSCRMSGACSIHPSVNALHQLLLSQIQEISFYIVKLKEFGFLNYEAMNFIISCLSMFLINTSFNQKQYLETVFRLYNLKTEAKEKYLSYCKEHELPCEIVNSNFELHDDTTINWLIKYSQTNILNRAKNYDKTKHRLFELVILYSRLCAINLIKIKKIEKDFREFDFELIRFFALTNSYSIRNEKIIRRIKEFCNSALKINKKLNTLYETRYGKKESANINTSVFEGKSILVCGDDLDELEKLLCTLESLKIESINVYTNSALIMAHFYPYFKQNKYLKGHFGTDNAEYDLSVFKGAILITQNFIQKIDSLYRGEIFSNKLISFSKVFDIKDDDYKPVIDAALKIEGYSKNTRSAPLAIQYDEKEISELIKNYNEKSITIIAGAMDDENYLREYEGKTAISLNYPIEEDILIKTIEKLKEKGTEITVIFSQCTLFALNSLLSLLNQDIDLKMADCSHILINPHVIECLRDDFNVKVI